MAKLIKIDTAKVVFVVDEVPRPNEAGYLTLNYALLEALLSRGWSIDVIVCGFRLKDLIAGLPELYDSSHVELSAVHAMAVRGRLVPKPHRLVPAVWYLAFSRLSRILGRFGRRDSRRSDLAVVGRWMRPSEERWVQKSIDCRGPAVVVADTIFRATVFRDRRNAPFVKAIIAHDVFTDRIESLGSRGFEVIPGGLTEGVEAELLGTADVVGAVHLVDRDRIAGMVDAVEVVVASMPMKPVSAQARKANEDVELIFIGSATVHNLDGLNWFVSEIFPGILSEFPNVVLNVVGGVGNRAVIPPGIAESLRVWGVVEDLGQVMQKRLVGLVPILAGSGLKIKSLDYLRYGCPVVSTSTGATGLESVEGAPVIVADDENFADAVLKLLRLETEQWKALEIRAVRSAEAGGVGAAMGSFLDALEREIS